MKTIKEFIYESNKFSQLKQGDVVAVVCKNYNRETVSIQKTTIKKISSSEIQVNISSGGDLLTFDKEDGSSSSIGGMWSGNNYSLRLPNDLKDKIKNGYYCEYGDKFKITINQFEK